MVGKSKCSLNQKECILVGMRPARSLPYGGGGLCLEGICPAEGSLCRGVSQGDPRKEHETRDRDTPQKETPLEGTWDQAVRQEVTSYRDRPMDRMTDTRL